MEISDLVLVSLFSDANSARDALRDVEGKDEAKVFLKEMSEEIQRLNNQSKLFLVFYMRVKYDKTVTDDIIDTKELSEKIIDLSKGKINSQVMKTLEKDMNKGDLDRFKTTLERAGIVETFKFGKKFGTSLMMGTELKEALLERMARILFGDSFVRGASLGNKTSGAMVMSRTLQQQIMVTIETVCRTVKAMSGGTGKHEGVIGNLEKKKRAVNSMPCSAINRESFSRLLESIKTDISDLQKGGGKEIYKILCDQIDQKRSEVTGSLFSQNVNREIEEDYRLRTAVGLVAGVEDDKRMKRMMSIEIETLLKTAKSLKRTRELYKDINTKLNNMVID